MYNIKIDTSTLAALRRGDVLLIKKLLRESDENIIKALKKYKGDDIAYLQGISAVIDRLLEVFDA